MAYRNVGLAPDVESYYPEHVATFEAFGFEHVGALLPDIDEAQAAQLQSVFAGDDGQELRDSVITATPVLRSSDSDAFVEVSRWCGEPMLRFWTLLTDGSLVCTMTPVERLPQLTNNSPFLVRLGVDEHLIRSSVPDKGRSARMATTTSPAQAWHEHQEHAAQYAAQRSSAPVRHESMSTSIAIAEQADVHARRCQQVGFRYVFTGIALLGTLGMILAAGLMSVLGEDEGSPLPAAALYASLVVPVVSIVGLRRMMRSIFRWRRIRPAFRFRPI